MTSGTSSIINGVVIMVEVQQEKLASLREEISGRFVGKLDVDGALRAD